MEIIKYRFAWNIDENIGRIQLKNKNEKWTPVFQIKDPNEFRVIIDLLRNEKPIYYRNNQIQSAEEPVGEDE